MKSVTVFRDAPYCEYDGAHKIIYSFYDDLDRIAAEDYMPNTQDILFTRAPTVGVTETKLTLKRISFR